MQRLRPSIVLALACAVGLLVAYVDSRPTWDDTGILVGGTLLASALFGALLTRRPWLAALAIGGWAPVLSILGGRGPAALIVLGIALVGAYSGALARRL